MSRSRSSLALAAELYDAAINPLRWEGILDRLAREIGARGVAVTVLETLQRYHFSLTVTNSLYSSEIRSRYESEFAQYEEQAYRYLATRAVGEVVCDPASLLDPVGFRKRPDVAFLERNAGVLDRFAMRLNDERAWFDCITFQYAVTRSNIRPAEQRVLRHYVPHLAKAIDLSRSFNELRHRYRAVLGVLDRFLIAVVIVLEDGQIVLANDNARRLLEERNGLGSRTNDVLFAHECRADAQLRAAIHRASVLAAETSAGHATKLLVQKRSSLEHYLVDVSPIRDTDQEVERNLAGAFITIVDPDQQLPLGTDGLAALYGLTPAEVEVVAELFAGKTNRQIAASRDVSVETVKSHIRVIFSKTGACNRTELVSRLLKVTLPIR